MTKKEIAGIVETLVQEIAVSYGATIEVKQIKVGGKMVHSDVAVGGVFDLDACRGLLARALQAKRAELTGHFTATQQKAVEAAYDLQGVKQPS